ncbi:aerolysin family beta-barrel pore-forming toxin [Photobacterium sp. WH77]|uniref:aerolysin family beta-barrel pore-forming toxin n=1 Tax=unclassified Photobacterium TaxID=2628852 RepID=UPI001EDA0403|nr:MULTISPECIES: aerolysin family beta-barrel pore-forming toxin [unclassified Photobacterium]MCG2839104.1 aerolysin family beta-barrel pore-forming toxin [Photobacterium sp. WH77]MCG2846753.1 aerolysin family beta-barrel pore-forming toxin [Photobacterium sp. WH80]MDO6583099.1 aerolysin family beta-barrel pore-forming toxin [Photobacterium sp. 2_MG-2023]
MKKQITPLLIILPFGHIASVSALETSAFYPEEVEIHYNLGPETCNADFRPVTRSEALRFRDSIMNKIGKWSYVSLADGWVIMGPGYMGEIKQGTASHTACYPLNADTNILSFPAISIDEGSKERVEWTLLSDQDDFVKPAAYLAHHMGYAWVGGPKGNQVGDDMKVWWDSNESAWNIRGNDGPCDGYRCQDMTTIKVKNFAYTMDPASFKIDGSIVNSNSQLVNTISSTAVNKTSIQQQYVIDISYNTSTSWSQSNDYSFSESIEVSSTFKSPKVTGGVEKSISVTFGATQAWGSTSGGEESNRVTIQARPVVPANSALKVLLNVYRADISYPYVFDADVSYELGFDGFMRWGGNGLLWHPKDRPDFTSNFAIGRFAGNEKSLEFQWDHRDITGMNKTWDWNWIAQTAGSYDTRYWLGKVLAPKKARVKGQFYAEDQFTGELYFEEIALPQGDSNTASMEKSIQDQLEDAGLKDVQVSVRKADTGV